MATHSGSAYISIFGKAVPGSFASAAKEGLSSAGTVTTKGFSALGVAAGNLLSVGLSKAISLVGSSIHGAIQSADALNRFPIVMENLGFSSEQSAAAIDKLKAGLDGLPTGLGEATSYVRQFTSMNGDLERSTSIYLALNDALRVGGASAEEQTTAMSMLQRMYASGKVQARSYATLMKTMGGTLTEAAHAMGYASAEVGGDMYNALQKGTLSMDGLMDAIIKLDQEGGDGFESLSEKAKKMPLTFDEQMTLMQKNITAGLKDIINEIGTDNLAAPFQAFGEAMKQVATDVKPLFTVLGQLLSTLKPVLPELIKFALAAVTIYGAAKLFVGTALKIKALVTAFQSLKTGLAIAGTGTNALANLGNTAAQAGGKFAMSASQMLAGAASIGAIGLALAGAGVGFFLMAQGCAAIAEAGLPATAALMIMGEILLGFVFVVGQFATQLDTAATGLVALGGALALAGAGFFLMGAGAALVGSAGAGAVVAIGLMGATLIGLVVVLGIFAPLLDMAVPFVDAFGLAVLMCGAGIGLAAAGIAVMVAAITGLVSQLPIVAEYGLQAAVGFAGIAASVVLCAAGCVALAGGLLVLAGGMVALLPAALAADAEMLIFTATIGAAALGAMALAGGFMMTIGTAMMLGSVINGIANDCANAVESMWTLQGSVDVVSAGIDALQGVAEGVFSAIVGAFQSTSGNVQSEAWNMVNGINSAMDAAGAGAYEAGARVGEGLANGMRSQWWNVHDAAQSLVDEAQRAVEARAKIGSPSRLFNKVGRWIPAGFAGGIVAGVNAVRLAANGMVGAVERATDSFMPRIANTGTLQGATATAGAGGAIGGNGGATIYFDNARLNDDVEIRNAAELLFKEIRRKEAM